MGPEPVRHLARGARMTPAARYQTAAEILDEILGGVAAEKALTNWARRARFAGSKDRAAVRDHVFDVLRQRQSCAARGGPDGRGLILGLLRGDGIDPDTVFTGDGYGPAVLSEAEREAGDAGDVLDLPAWIVAPMRAALGEDFDRTERALRERAPVMLRVNLAKSDPVAARAALADEGVTAEPVAGSATALVVTEGARRIRLGRTYLDGLVELQDGSSQAAVAALAGRAPARVLDYCAGGGGKSLALAALCSAEIYAHDADPARMSDLPERAARAGADITRLDREEIAGHAPYDLVICDVPCSGSGTWRRTPEMKWRFSEADLAALVQTQAEILDEAAAHVALGGYLAYMTCSILAEENEAQTEGFGARHPGFALRGTRRWPVSASGDGFFLAQFERVS